MKNNARLSVSVAATPSPQEVSAAPSPRLPHRTIGSSDIPAAEAPPAPSATGASQLRRFWVIVSWTAFAAWAAGILWLSSLGSRELQDFGPWFMRFLNADKLSHAVAFMVGSVLLAFALLTSTAARPPVIAGLAILGISLFGATDEWHQLYTPGRSGADVADWLADTVGAMIGASLFLHFHGRFRIAKSRCPVGAVAPGTRGA